MFNHRYHVKRLVFGIGFVGSGIPPRCHDTLAHQHMIALLTSIAVRTQAIKSEARFILGEHTCHKPITVSGTSGTLTNRLIQYLYCGYDCIRVMTRDKTRSGRLDEFKISDALVIDCDISAE